MVIDELEISEFVKKEVSTLRILLGCFVYSYTARVAFELFLAIDSTFLWRNINICTEYFLQSAGIYTYVSLLPVFDIIPIVAIFYFHSKNFKFTTKSAAVHNRLSASSGIQEDQERFYGSFREDFYSVDTDSESDSTSLRGSSGGKNLSALLKSV